MPRPRRYATNEERQAAYRKRLKETTYVVDKRILDQHHRKLDLLKDAVWAACAAGDPVAKQVRSNSSDTILEKLIAYFRQQANTQQGGESNP
jgi:hypothetical protein